MKFAKYVLYILLDFLVLFSDNVIKKFFNPSTLLRGVDAGVPSGTPCFIYRGFLAMNIMVHVGFLTSFRITAFAFLQVSV